MNNDLVSGDRMPAEWEPHRATWMAWPHAAATWPKRLAQAQAEFKELVSAIAESEPVELLSGNTEPDFLDLLENEIETIRKGGQDIRIVPIATNDSWIRDFGPTFTLRPSSVNPRSNLSSPGVRTQAEAAELVANVWRFNAWGKKYEPYDLDASAGIAIATVCSATLNPIDLVFEGGAVESNGAGALLTTSSCAFSSSRNPHQSHLAIAETIRSQLSGRIIGVLPGAELIGDDTDGHIDQLARFVDAQTVVCAVAKPSDPQYPSLNRHWEALVQLNQDFGLGWSMVELPIPETPVVADGVRLPASYCNFYFSRGACLVPQFQSDTDAIAIRILSDVITDRPVIGLPSKNLAVGFGSFHCLTQSEPVANTPSSD